MIQIIGLRNNLDIHIREKLSLPQSRLPEYMERINKYAKGSLILSTCNRTEIYIDSDEAFPLNKLFSILEWDEDLMKHVFYDSGRRAVTHLMEVSCGFHSKIYGEDQILGQIRQSFNLSTETDNSSKSIHRLFQTAISCGKEFRTKSGLNKIPVSSASIVSNQCTERKISSVMIIGYGEVGRLVEKYLMSTDIGKVYIVVRKKSNLVPMDERISFIEFHEKKDHYDSVDCIISCTSSPHIIISKDDLPARTYTLFDLAVPRDLDPSLSRRQDVELIDIDDISLLDDKNKRRRKDIMVEHRHIVEEKISDYADREALSYIVPHIRDIKESGSRVAEKRIRTFKNKKETKDSEELAKAMIESTSDFYINRAIKVLKNAQLEGCGEECLGYLKEIFMAE